MMHLHISVRVPPHRVEELLDRIYRIADRNGTFSITGLIDEYREDVYLELQPKENHRDHE